MQVRSVEKESSGKFVITLEIEAHQADSFLEKKEKLADLLNQADCLATAELLKQALLVRRLQNPLHRLYHRTGYT